MRISRTHLQAFCILGILFAIADVGLGIARATLAQKMENIGAPTISRATDEEFRARIMRCGCGSKLLELLEAYEARAAKLSAIAATAQREWSNDSMRDGSINVVLFLLLLYGLRRLGADDFRRGQGSGNAL
jgi:hypothetical protein